MEDVIYPPQSPFELYIRTHLEKKAGQNPVFSFSFLPEYRLDGFLIRLSFDPYHIMDTDGTGTGRGLWSYITGFIDNLSLSTEIFTLDISYDLILPSDAFGVSSALTNSFISSAFPLQLLSRMDTDIYSHTFSISDLRFNDERAYFNYNGHITFPFWPSRIGFSLLAEITDLESSSSSYYPEIYLATPLFYSDSLSLDLQVTGAMMLDSSFHPSGWGLKISSPLTFSAFTFDTGIAMTNGSLQYGRLLNGYETHRDNKNTVILYSSLFYDTDGFDVVADLQLPMDTGSGKFVTGEDYLSLELSFQMFGISFSAGFRSRGLFTEDFNHAVRTYSQSFVSMGYRNDAISTSLSFNFNENLEPEITLTATIATYKALFSKTGELATSPSWMDITLFTGYSHDASSSIFIRPVLSFTWGEANRLALRLPLAFSTDSENFIIVSENDNTWFNFGLGNDSSIEIFFDFLTDISSVIEEASFSQKGSFLYFIASRDAQEMPSTLFSGFRAHGKEDHLSLNTGFSTSSGASVNLFVDNMELPRLFNLTISITPMRTHGPRMILDNLLDISFSDSDFMAYLITQLSIEQDFIDGNLVFRLFGNTYSDFSPHHFDTHFTDARDLSLSGGLDISISAGDLSFILSGGVSTGRARRVWYDEFSWRDALSVPDIENLEGISPFASAGMKWDNGLFSLSVNYSVDDFTSIGKKGTDKFSASLAYSYNDFIISFSWSHRNFFSWLSHIDSINPFDGEDSLWAVSLEKTLGHLSFYTSVYLARELERDETWLNVVVPSHSSTYLGFSLITSLRF